MPEDIMTLGFGFSTNAADNEITKLVNAFTELEAKSGSAQKAVQQMFGSAFAQSLKFARKEIGKINSGLLNTARLANQAMGALNSMQKNVISSTPVNIPPVQQTVINSWYQYNTQVNMAQTSTQNVALAVKNINPAPVQKLAEANKKASDSAGELNAMLKRTFGKAALFEALRKSTMNAIDFGVELAQIGSIARDYDLSKVKKGLLEISSAYGGAIQNANALYYAYSSGVSGSETDLMRFTAEMSKLSVLIRSNVTQTVNAATSAMNAYNVTASEAAKITDLFYTIVEKGKASGSELANSFGQVSPTAKTLGVTLDELGAAITSLSKVQPTRVAITGLNNMLSKILKPTKESRLAFQRMGVDVSYSAVQTKGFAQVMEELHTALQSNQQEIKNMFPDIRGQRAAMYLLGAGWKDFQTMLVDFGAKAGNADRAMEILNKNLDYQLSVLPNTIAKIKIAIGDTIKYILTLGGALTPVIASFNQMGRTGQTVIGSFVAIAGVITLLKTVTAAYHGMKLLEMKYNSALAVQRTAELAQRTANTGAIAAETSALLANTAARTANAASGAAGTAVSMASGGFKAGFDSVFNVSLKSFTKFFSRLMHPIKTLQTILHAAKISGSFSAIGAAFMKIGVIVGKTAGFFKAAFTVIAGAVSLMKVAIVGGVMAIVGVVDILQSLFRTGNWFDGSVILRPIANFLTGYNKEVERANNIERNMREWKNSMTIEKEVAEFEHNIQASLVSIFSQDIFKDASVKQQISSNFSGLSGAMLSYKRKEVEDKERIAIAKEDLKTASRLVRIAIENKKSQEEINEAVKKRNEAQEKLQKIEADFRERQGLITSEYQKLIDTVKAQQEAQKNIIKTFEEYRYSMASDAQKKIIQENRYATELNNFQTAIRDKNFSVAEGALKNMMSAHNSLMEMANASIKTYKQLFDDTENDMFNFLLESYTKTNDKVNALRAKAGQMYMESGVSFNAGQVQISSGANADLTASYKKAKTAIDLNIRALKLEIGEKQKLAQAEARVNQNTLQLINSMNKYSSTAVDAVNALSADAVKLQSRNFEKLPAFAPQQQQQLGLEKLQADLSAAYQRARDVAEAFNQEAVKRKTEAENQKASLEVQMEGFMQKVETHTADLAKNFGPIQASLQDLAHKMSSLKPEEVEKRLRSIEGALKNFGVVTF